METDETVAKNAEESTIARAVRLIGGPSEMARRVGNYGRGKPLTCEAVRKWVKAGKAPAEQCIAIVAVCSGTPAAVTYRDLRPDVYPADLDVQSPAVA